MGLNLTAVVLTYNEALNIEDCLRSLLPLDCRIVVVDSGSNDQTLNILKTFNVDTYYNEFKNYGDQRNWSQQNTNIKTEWILHLDADERLSKELCKNIINVFNSGSNSQLDGYLISRRTLFMNKFIR